MNNILDTAARMPQPTRRPSLRRAAAATPPLASPPPQPPTPTRPAPPIAPLPAGAPADTTGRAVAHKLSLLWGQQAIIDNRAGAGGIVGAEVAARAVADGYHLLVCSIHHTVLPSLRPRLSYDIERDFVPLTFGSMVPVVLVAPPSLPANNVAELIALDKKSPGQLSFGSSGSGGGTHLAGELFNMQAGTRLLHVP